MKVLHIDINDIITGKSGKQLDLSFISKIKQEKSKNNKHITILTDNEDVKTVIMLALQSAKLDDSVYVFSCKECIGRNTALSNQVEKKAQLQDGSYSYRSGKNIIEQTIATDDSAVGRRIKEKASAMECIRNKYGSIEILHSCKSPINNDILSNPNSPQEAKYLAYYKSLYANINIQFTRLEDIKGNGGTKYIKFNDLKNKDLVSKAIEAYIEEKQILIPERHDETIIDLKNDNIIEIIEEDIGRRRPDPKNLEKLEFLERLLSHEAGINVKELNFNSKKPNILYGIGLSTLGAGISAAVPMDIVSVIFNAKMLQEYIALKYKTQQKPQLFLLIADQMAMDSNSGQLDAVVKARNYYIKVVDAILKYFGMRDDVNIILSSKFTQTKEYEDILNQVASHEGALDCTIGYSNSNIDLAKYYYNNEAAHMEYLYQMMDSGIKFSYIYSEEKRININKPEIDYEKEFKELKTYSEMKFDLHYKSIYKDHMQIVNYIANTYGKKYIPHFYRDGQSKERLIIGGYIDYTTRNNNLGEKTIQQIANSMQYRHICPSLKKCSEYGFISNEAVTDDICSLHANILDKISKAEEMPQETPVEEHIELNIDEPVTPIEAGIFQYNALNMIYPEGEFSAKGVLSYFRRTAVNFAQNEPLYVAFSCNKSNTLDYVIAATDCVVSTGILCTAFSMIEVCDIVPFVTAISGYLIACIACRVSEKNKLISCHLGAVVEHTLAGAVIASSLALFSECSVEFILLKYCAAPAAISLIGYGSKIITQDVKSTKGSDMGYCILANLPMFLLAYFTYSTNLFFIGGGIGKGISSLIMDLKRNHQEDNDCSIADVIFKAAIYGSCSMVLYTTLPMHFETAEIFPYIGISLVEALLLYYILPALSRAKRKADEDKVGLTIGEKVDMAIMALILSSSTAYAINCAGTGILGILPLIISISAYPLILRAKSIVFAHYRAGDEKAKLPISHRLGFATMQAIPMVATLLCSINLFTNQTFIANISSYLCQIPGFASFMNDYISIAGSSFVEHLSIAFCMSFVLYGAFGCATRGYEALTGEKILGDNSKRPYMCVESIIRFPFEFLKFFVLGLLKVFSFLAPLISGLVLGAGKFAVLTISNQEFQDRVRQKYNDNGIKLTVLYVLSEIAITVVLSIYDQISYFCCNTFLMLECCDFVSIAQDSIKFSMYSLIESTESFAGQVIRPMRRNYIEKLSIV